jgi:hypothetical protein
MEYKVVPFKAGIMANEGVGKAAAQLQALVGQHASDGWTYHGLESLATTVVTPAVPGTSGCLGLGSTEGRPEVRSNATFYVAVFYKS